MVSVSPNNICLVSADDGFKSKIGGIWHRRAE